MRLRTIALTSFVRRRARAVFLVSGLLIGIATVVALLSLTASLTAQAKTSMKSYGANIMIAPRTNDVSLTYAGMSVGGVSVGEREIDAADLARIDAIPASPSIAVVAPELVGAVTANGQKALLMGVRPDDQFKLKQWWSVDLGRAPRNDHEMIVGAAAARALKLDMGSYVRINGRRFTVTGVLRETGSQDDDLLIADLGAVQDVLDKPGKLTMIEVAALYSGASVDEIVAQLSDALPQARVTAMQEVVRSRLHAVDRFRQFSYVVAGVVIAIEILVVFLTMMSSVSSRTREIGVFRALGFRSTHIVRLILIEGAVASLIAGVLGYAAGMAASSFVLPLVADGAQLDWSPFLAPAAVLLALTVGALATLYPALHASRLDPTEALRAL